MFDSFFDKVAGLQVFPVNIAKFLGTSILKNICERMLPNQALTFNHLIF